MRNVLVVGILIGFVCAILSCSSGDANPMFRIRNERATKANVQIQTSGGNTININDVQPGQVTAYQTAAEGNITATASIQGESVSPTITFSAAKNNIYTIAIATGDPPTLRIDRP